ncbi:NAD-binding oxidoreductase [Clostridium botulinum B2 128]|uniref:sulfide/dihydroorotate dehydrogenase-like FAD/NAD-binding protein n=1 Tax=Clostridium botulinum TaxID=1491 RepID=UPI0005F8DFE5|nr:sulfide/dihydroorotate dehydrogenase-like FAD/NAD-binding protein [Clostridium botulinum]KEI74027.1 NAD-binding oxidoreductase [Clostridium botulinum B2 128]MBY6952781.1 sulfide/dihydroorotate dehydrogenase-like FAD/NAD-binding protein [Clostridium botulinum]MCR1139339.1 sulfide/dihydroorotate dehydrogenase-like FAD/NAD-binding protein [Clostridium botulinum]MCR1166209.1 sulfide/dihydroorotate dehydrogenase-like FAD/NAD-binding protein [Clostridium botulinum]NEZ77464.1 sulfide/dihydroorotat
MYKILEKKNIAPSIFLMKIEAPRVAKSAKPGQFVIVKMDEKGERIPLTICDYDKEEGSVTIVIQAIGSSTKKMDSFKEGDSFRDFVGPLGQPSDFVNENLDDIKKKKMVFIAGGLGAAPVYPQIKWLSDHGIKADVIIGCKSKEHLILEEEMKKVAGNVYVATDDGSYGYKGLVTNLLKDLIDKEGKTYDHVVAIGPMIMMKFVTLLTKEYNIKTIVSLNTLMVDGTGMCGACRVTVGGQTKFACVDGPEFDGHLVDFEEAIRRQQMYKTEEGKKLLEDQEKAEGHVCHVGLDGDK